MNENSCRLLGVYDEMSAFLTQINLYRGHGLLESHTLALFLQLYNGHPWRRDTGKDYSTCACVTFDDHRGKHGFPVSGEANFMMTSTSLALRNQGLQDC